MNAKLVFGIMLPAFVVVVLVGLSTLDIDFSVNISTENFVNANALFDEESAELVQTITLKNDFFLPKKYELPALRVCIQDAEGRRAPESLTIYYSEGTFSSPSDFLSDEIFYADYPTRVSVEIPAHSEKTVHISVEARSRYRSKLDYDDIDDFYQYTTMLLIEPKSRNRYGSLCTDLESAEIANAVQIPLFHTENRIEKLLPEDANFNISDVLKPNQVRTYTIGYIDYEIEVIKVDSATADFRVNGEKTGNLEINESYKLADGAKIGISAIIVSENPDDNQVTFYLKKFKQ